LGDPEPVYRWTNRRTGRIAIASELERVQQRDLDSWERGQQVVIEDGLSADQAIELGIADGRAGTMEQLAVAAGLPTVPAPVRDRWLVSELENLAGQTWLMRILLFVGFFALSVELGSPGLGVPGFVSMVCLLFYFWAQFLNGTAEWLEVLLFLGGVACLAVELLLLPGFGIFGLGGVLMIIASLILASQTFVLPHDSRELAAVSGNLVGVFIACGGVVAGLVTLRYFAHQIPLLRELVLPQPSDDVLAERDLREAMVAWEYLQGQTGKAISVLRPAGKARFGDATVAVVAQGEFIDAGESVRVVDVQGNRVTVERLPG
jgi:membrane-bound ClpP family serine protease